MKYGYGKTVDLPFDEAVQRTTELLKEKGFGILTEIDVKQTLKEKINKDFKQYKILGACNPPKAYEALQAEEEIGLLLPCNAIVYESQGGVTVSAIDPESIFSVVDNEELQPLAKEVGRLLRNVIDSI